MFEIINLMFEFFLYAYYIRLWARTLFFRKKKKWKKNKNSRHQDIQSRLGLASILIMYESHSWTHLYDYILKSFRPGLIIKKYWRSWKFVKISSHSRLSIYTLIYTIIKKSWHGNCPSLGLVSKYWSHSSLLFNLKLYIIIIK